MKNKRIKKTIVAVSGGFDPIHVGHVRMFQEAKKFGDELVVILNNDNWLEKKKGIVFMPEEQRKELIEAIKCVDRVVLTKHKKNTTDMSVCAELKALKPDIFVNGGDMTKNNIPEVPVCEKIGCEMIFNIGSGGKMQSSSWLLSDYMKKMSEIKEKNENLKIILGSQSPWRKKILEKMGYDPEVIPSYIDEKKIRFKDPIKLTLALAKAKADAVLLKIENRNSGILIASDQVVVCNGKILEKPNDEKEAREFLKMYAKYPAETVTSVVVINIGSGKKVYGTDIAKIWMDPIPRSIIDQYISTKDPFLHAGGFDYEYPLVSSYVRRIEGETDSVSGLPYILIEKLIRSVK
ncbi:MAG: Maf family nucleotide pyrophosphatase [Patescibacteria group bacterium]|nr:Maf family nucleotide pyrophosphatase [Patescibacteria group bacterium]